MNNHRMNRRKFLDWIAWMAGGALAAPWLPAALPGLTARVGLLLPTAANRPGPAAQFVHGFQLALTGANRTLDLTTAEEITTPARAYEALEPMLAAGLRTFVWMSDSPLSAALRERVTQAGALLLQSGAGANLPRSADQSPSVFHHDLGVWQGAWALGAWAAANLGRRASLLSSLYDSGYDALYAFQLGFESAGGQALRTRVSLRSGDAQAALAQARAERPDVVAGFYSGPAASEFLRAYVSAGLGSTPLAGPGFLTAEDGAPLTLTAPVYTALGWAAGLKQPQAFAFTSAYRRTWGSPPGPFDLLGYEAAALLDAALRRAEANPTLSTQMAWRGLAITTPRGELRQNPGSQSFSGPLYLRLAKPAAGGFENALVSTLSAPPAANPALRALQGSLKTGFSSAYLFE